MLVDGDMMHSRMDLGGAGIASPTSAIPAISDFLKVILLIRIFIDPRFLKPLSFYGFKFPLTEVR